MAGFIGSPSMNFLPGRLEGDKLELPFGDRRGAGAPAGRAEGRGDGGGKRDVIVGIRPEHFEDAAIEPDRPGLMKFKAKVDVVESMGSELYAYFDVETEEEVQSDELADLAKDAGMEDLPSGGRPARRRAAGLRLQGRPPAARSSSCSTRRRSSCSTPTAARASPTTRHGNGAGSKAASAAARPEAAHESAGNAFQAA